MLADDFDEHEFSKLGEHGLAARAAKLAFFGSDVKQIDQPTLAGRGHLRVKHSRQGFEQRIERPCIAAKKTTHEMTVFLAGGVMVKDKRQVTICRAKIHVEIGLGMDPGRRTHYVPVTHRKDDDIARFETGANLGVLGQNCPARA